ncbi:MAG TPA: hypothetical protein VMK12_22120 [Anaeromyxobacteraceae bacterium]|nr:hypothetical protein [Anaeromyxobacteraceae bacterium]
MRDARQIIDELREEIRRIERKPPSARMHPVPTGRPDLDALLPGGGFPRGTLTELAGGHACGKTKVALSVLAAAMGKEGLAAFVDGRSEFYPPAAAALGIDLARLLVVRPSAREGTVEEALRQVLWSTETLLSSGAFEAVAIDAPTGACGRVVGGGILPSVLRRLPAAAARGGTVGIWLGTPGGVPVPAAVRFEISAGGAVIRRTFGRGESLKPALALGAHHAA